MRSYFSWWRESDTILVVGGVMLVVLQKSFAILVRVLAWVGGYGARAIAALVFMGIAVPVIGDVLKSLVTEAIFLLLCISFMRVDLSALRNHLQRPGLILAITGWTTFAVPLIIGFSCLAMGLHKHSPDVFLGLMLQSVASPMMAAPALAALMGLDTTLAVITLVTGTSLVPLSAPLFTYAFFGSALTLSPLALGLKLFAMLAGSLALATAIRCVIGAAAIERHKKAIDGLNILLMLVFVTAVMSAVAGSFFAKPLNVIEIAVFAFAIFFALFGFTILIFRRIGYDDAIVLGLVVAQRNMGLMLAATDGALPELTWLYFALSQFPIYMSPQLFKPLVRRKVESRYVCLGSEVRRRVE